MFSIFTLGKIKSNKRLTDSSTVSTEGSSDNAG